MIVRTAKMPMPFSQHAQVAQQQRPERDERGAAGRLQDDAARLRRGARAAALPIDGAAVLIPSGPCRSG